LNVDDNCSYTEKENMCVTNYSKGISVLVLTRDRISERSKERKDGTCVYDAFAYINWICWKITALGFVRGKMNLKR